MQRGDHGRERSSHRTSVAWCPRLAVPVCKTTSYFALRPSDDRLTNIRRGSSAPLSPQPCRALPPGRRTIGSMPEATTAEAVRLLTDQDYRARMIAALSDVRTKLGGPGASDRAAEAILEIARDPKVSMEPRYN